MIYADFDYYCSTYYGKQIQDPEEYEKFATQAAFELDYFTLGKASKNADMEAVKMASCAVAEQFKILDTAELNAASGEIASESVGSHSRTYRSAAEISASVRGQIKAVIERYLATTGLLYRGVPTCIHHTQLH